GPCALPRDAARRAALAPAGEVLGESPPAVLVVVLALRRLERQPRLTDHVAALEHERERAVDALRREHGGRRLLERRGVGSVSGHRIVEAPAPGEETLGLGVVRAVHEP